MTKILKVYLKEILVGDLTQQKDGNLTFTYETFYLEKGLQPLSAQLPLRAERYEGSSVKAFFSGMLPDEEVRHRLSSYLGVSERNPFALLQAVGGECAGAVSLYPEGVAIPSHEAGEWDFLDEQRLCQILDLLKKRPLLVGEEGIRLSLAGAQDKLAVGIKDGKIALVRGNGPTTHIIKPGISGVEGSVYNEFFCMKLAKAMGIEVPSVDILFLQDTPYFIVERYDRFINQQGTVERLHQEDFCQAQGIMPELKYEREGGPSISKCQELLNKVSIHPALDQMKLLERVIFNYLIGNSDAHGKNFSLLYRSLKPELAPAYDLISTAIYPHLSNKMAMKIGGKYLPEDVSTRHWLTLVPQTSVARKNMIKKLSKFSSLCLERTRLLRGLFHQQKITSPVVGDIGSVIHERYSRIQSSLHFDSAAD